MSATTPEPLRALFFVVRPDGQRMVPLIAIDELPSFVKIQGVPRELTALKITGMNSIGVFEARPQQHVVEGVYSGAPPTNHPIDMRSTIEDQAASARTDGKPTSSSANDLPQVGTMGKKVYCTHWMKTGECSFVQTGCKYKHEMPLDLDELKRLGHNEIPQWFRELYGIPPLNLPPGVKFPSYTIQDSKVQKSDNWRKVQTLNQNVGRKNVAAQGGQRYTHRSTRGTDRPFHYSDKSKGKLASFQDREREAREAQELAKARDKENEKRRKANQGRWPGLSPGHGSVFKHNPEPKNGYDSEAECSDLLSDDERYEKMSDADFRKQELARAEAARASSSSSPASFASSSTTIQGSAEPRPGRAGGNGGSNGNRRRKGRGNGNSNGN
ncbi:uncharacterized protein A1O9_00966 [Exophiala aquamarina CBS 119918]|uniref:C3H1-type domain-containing protein n=1 Tax=Exophiala aquamarina CBS 119918 TaxID=1182545 RepID=A0A072PSY6_9EURO|nr:uncharacterized protein A1O9_00966 [Exophiala aquamarina CBS 119918]KEF62991.1 hypothetical protein A1O9_00966 [Exophiala aquamarina CBS 119918]